MCSWISTNRFSPTWCFSVCQNVRYNRSFQKEHGNTHGSGRKKSTNCGQLICETFCTPLKHCCILWSFKLVWNKKTEPQKMVHIKFRNTLRYFFTWILHKWALVYHYCTDLLTKPGLRIRAKIDHGSGLKKNYTWLGQWSIIWCI